jgi:hypothetical protein
VENITSLALKRMENIIAEQAAKCMKYETMHATAKVNANLELEKEKLKQEECILEMQHKYERLISYACCRCKLPCTEEIRRCLVWGHLCHLTCQVIPWVFLTL